MRSPALGPSLHSATDWHRSFLDTDMYLQMEEECNNVISLALDGSERRWWQEV